MARAPSLFLPKTARNPTRHARDPPETTGRTSGRNRPPANGNRSEQAPEPQSLVERLKTLGERATRESDFRQSAIAKAVEDVERIVEDLKLAVEQMEEVLELVELAERQKSADERELQSLRRVLGQFRQPFARREERRPDRRDDRRDVRRGDRRPGDDRPRGDRPAEDRPPEDRPHDQAPEDQPHEDHPPEEPQQEEQDERTDL